MLKVLIIEAISKDPYHTVFSPLGPAYLASYLCKYSKIKEIDVKMIFSDGEFDFRRYNPDIVGISSVTETFNIAKRIAAFVKGNKDIPVVIGGVHISALPSNMSSDMDAAVIGEGEQTFLELLETHAGKGLTKANLSGIQGIAYRDDGRLIQTKERELIAPLDLIPPPARQLQKKNKRDIWMITSRGCPYKCIFCSAAQFWKTVRFFSPRYVVNEIKSLIEMYHPETINIVDDLFILQKQRFNEIVDLIVKEKINERVRFTVLVRPNLIDEDICLGLKRMNVTLVGCGFESGSAKALSVIKQNQTLEDNVNATRLLRKHGILVGAFFMMGIPGETIKDMEETYHFIQEQEYSRGESYVLTPFPGTQVWDSAKSRGLVNDNMNWDHFTMDFYKHPKDSIIVSEVPREELFKEYMRMRKMWERKKAMVTSPVEALRTAGILYLVKLIRHNPYRVWSFFIAFLRASFTRRK
ncbi:MAG: radical SAM protein [Candidatus Omnitrophica bacterium]|nr:radical SAM protein [Candidatus Omnitrophota bacterium]MDD5552663.1 radical SAM protein [Candidatus Omnitrophota bacterium]